MLQLYHAVVHPLMLCGIIIWWAIYPSYLKRLKTLQNRAIKIVALSHYRDNANSFYSQFNILLIDDLWKFEIVKFVCSDAAQSIYNRNLRSFKYYIFLKTTEHSNWATRQSTDNTHFNIPLYRTSKLPKCIKYEGGKVCNSIPQEIRSFSYGKFKLHYKNFFLLNILQVSLRVELELFLVFEPYQTVAAYCVTKC